MSNQNYLAVIKVVGVGGGGAVSYTHLDVYKRQAFMQAFVDFALGARELLVISADDPGTREVLAALAAAEDGRPRPTIRTFGEREGADVRIVAIDDSGPVKFTVEVEGERYSSCLLYTSRCV